MSSRPAATEAPSSASASSKQGGAVLRAVWAAAWLIAPFVLTLVCYKFHQYWPWASRGRVHVVEPRSWELALFGIHMPAGLLTPEAWWQAHTVPVLDLISGLAYLAFVPAFIAAAFWWRFGRAHTPDTESRARRAMWAFFGMYVAGYATYLIYPAAPPWYFDRYGPGPAVLSAAPDPAGAARFDAVVHAAVFSKYYGQSTNVFGAIPSLHWATAFLLLLFCLEGRSMRWPSAVLFLAVAFGSVYLNHHYIVDGLIGMAYACASFGVARLLSKGRDGA